ncbi:hypothetical protein DFH06DRAFT_565788 [Mycena polygramma]|nr:hypothetical protein DFH06DRAFT_565788 [Mycena polygramma]
MPDLPLELLEAIAKEVEHGPSILNLRLVSRIFNAAATPLAFRVVVVKDSVKSAEAVSFLQGCDEVVTSVVHELFFDARHSDCTSGASGRAALTAVFSRLAKFTNLRSLRVDFHVHYSRAETPTHFLPLQTALFDALAANPPPPLVSLTLNSLLAVPHDIYKQEDFLRIFRPLRKLNISVLSGQVGNSWYRDGALEGFWDISVTHILRSATDLTALTLGSDRPWPIHGCFKGTFLPHLASLSLHQLVFDSPDPDTDAVQFILRHKARLTRLELYWCSIHSRSLDAVFPRPWYAVFELFEANLHDLREFVFTAYGGDPHFLYTRLDGWRGTVRIDGGDRDRPALESLRAAVKCRRGRKGDSRDDA